MADIPELHQREWRRFGGGAGAVVRPDVNGPGVLTPRMPARVHTIAFGYLFEDTTDPT